MSERRLETNVIECDVADKGQVPGLSGTVRALGDVGVRKAHYLPLHILCFRHDPFWDLKMSQDHRHPVKEIQGSGKTSGHFSFRKEEISLRDLC